MDPNHSSDLHEQISELRSRVIRLEEVLRRQMLAQKPEIPPVAPREFEPAATPPTVPPIQFAATPPASSLENKIPEVGASPFTRAVTLEDRSLESRIGSQWFNRIGILAVLIGMSWFLKLAIDNHWIGPLGRVLIGLIAGAGIIAWSERFQRRGYGAFAYSLKAVGSGILYLSLWAGFSLFHLMPASVAFAAMIAVTAFNGFMAWVQDAELLALYSIVGGLSTPLLLSTGENHEVSLFTYLLLLDVAVLILVILRPWSRLLFGAFSGTVIFFAGWWLSYYTDAQSGTTAFFLACFFLLFAFAPRLVRPSAYSNVATIKWDTLALVIMPIANPALGFLAFYAMFDQSKTAWAEPWLAVTFAAFYLLLLRLPARGILRESPPVLSMLYLTASVIFLTVAIPLKARGRWLTIGWLVQGAALLWIASRVRLVLLRGLALLCLALGLGVLILVHPPAAITPILNERFATYCVAIAVFAFDAWIAKQASDGEASESDPMPWINIAAMSALLVSALILVAVGWEIHSYWWFVRWRGIWKLMNDYKMYAQFTYSAFFMLFGAILLGAGFWKRSAFLRWQALVLLAFSIGKVFLVDVSALSQGYRILSFLGLGALLLGVSFVYQRDWLHLRDQKEQLTS